MFSILVVEDDETLNKMICAKLKQEQFEVHTAFDGEQALEVMDQVHVDILVCDIMMPKMDGYELTDAIRKANYTLPILMVTAKDQIEDMEKGFHVGTDDYLIKPFNMKEMVLRVHALLKRSQIMDEHQMTVGSTVLDYDALTVKIQEETQDLPPKEFYLLYKLLSSPNHIFTRLELMDEIWGMDSEADERTVDSHIKKLRRKFEECSDFEIVTVRGLGYKAKVHAERR